MSIITIEDRDKKLLLKIICYFINKHTFDSKLLKNLKTINSFYNAKQIFLGLNFQKQNSEHISWINFKGFDKYGSKLFTHLHSFCYHIY